MSPRRRRSGIKSLVGSWRGQQIARETLQDRLASLPYEVLEEFLRQRGFEPANRGHAVILMVRQFQSEAEELVSRYRGGVSFLNKEDTVSDAVADTTSDTVSTTAPAEEGARSQRNRHATTDAAEGIGVDTNRDTRTDTPGDTGIETVHDAAGDAAADTVLSPPESKIKSGSTRASTVSDTAPDTELDTVPDTVSDTASGTVVSPVSDAVVDAAAATVSDAVSSTAVDTVADTGSTRVSITASNTGSGPAGGTAEAAAADTPTDTSKDTGDTATNTLTDTPIDTSGQTAAAGEAVLVQDGRGGEKDPARPEDLRVRPPVTTPSRIVLPGSEKPLELPPATQVTWVQASEWRGPGRAAAEFLKERARWWLERRSAAEAGATQFVGVYLLPEQRATLEQLRSDTGMEAYKLVALALELLLHEVASGQALPELPPRDTRTSRVLYLFGLQARPRLDHEGKRLFVRLYPPLWQAVERISKGGHRSPSETCNIAMYVLAATLRHLAP